MEDNPYSKFIRLIRSQADDRIPVSFRFGTVLSANPLKVDVGSTIQTADDLVKSESVSELKSGDSVLVIPLEEDQRFLILCKVVNV